MKSFRPKYLAANFIQKKFGCQPKKNFTPDWGCDNIEQNYSVSDMQKNRNMFDPGKINEPKILHKIYKKRENGMESLC